MRSSSASRRFDRRSVRWCVVCGVALIAAMALAPQALARGAGRYAQRNLVSDQPGRAELIDPSLVNAWGLAFGPMTPAWVANNGADNSTLYSGGIGSPPPVKIPLTVSIPGGAPTGMVYNGSPGFVVHSGASSGPATFLFSSEAGRITGWNISVSPTEAQTAKTVPGAIFKGLAIANAAGGERIYATDFHNGKVDVWNSDFKRIHRRGAFRDPKIPSRFAPFGIQAVGNKLIVTYAKQDRDAEDDIPGAGQWLRRRLRHQRQAVAPLRPARAARLAVGRRPGAEGVRRGVWSALDRQLRRRADQRLRSAQRQAPRGAAAQERQPHQDRRAVGAAVRQRRDRNAEDPAVHGRAGRRVARAVR